MVFISEEETKITIVIDIKDTNDFILFSPEYFKELGINYVDSYVKLKSDKEQNNEKLEETAEPIVENENQEIPIAVNSQEQKGGNDEKNKLTVPYRYFVYLLSGKDKTEEPIKEKKVFNIVNALFKTKIYDKSKPEEKKWLPSFKNIFKKKEEPIVDISNITSNIDLQRKESVSTEGDKQKLLEVIPKDDEVLEKDNKEELEINETNDVVVYDDNIYDNKINYTNDRTKYYQLENLGNKNLYQIILEIDKDYNEKNVMKLLDYLQKKKYDKHDDIMDIFENSNLSYKEVENIVNDIINQVNMQLEKNIYIKEITSDGIYIINDKFVILDIEYADVDVKVDICNNIVLFIENIVGMNIETIKQTVINTNLYKIIVNLQESRIIEN